MRVAVAVILLAWLSACAPAWKQAPHAQRLQRERDPVLHEQVQGGQTPFDWWNHLLHSTVTPLGRTLSPSRWGHALSGGREALDCNLFDEVVDSTWFHNRMGRRRMSVQAVRAGPAELGPPAAGPLTVIGGKNQGVTPGVVIQDSAGVQWFVKFDPPAFPALSTGAEIVAQRLLHAAGYNVPEMYLRDLDLYRLRLDANALTSNEYNEVVPLTEKRLRDLLTQLNPNHRGTLRALFSRHMPGQPVGPFAYRGIRLDDPNDLIPHERRRSLRALWMFSAWMNNTDTRRHNTMDAFVPVDAEGRGYLMHYLIDFGDALGAAGDRTKFLAEGHEHFLDWWQIGRRFLTLGLTYPYWLELQKHSSRSVGTFESDVFDPERWRPVYSNPAFVEATNRDEFWAASVIARFDDEHIEAAVAAARYEAPVARWMQRVLQRRRDSVVRYAFQFALPLTDAQVQGQVVRFLDLEAERGWVPQQTQFVWTVTWNRSAAIDHDLAEGITREPIFDLAEAIERVNAEHGDAFADDPFVTLKVWRAKGQHRTPAVSLHVRYVQGRLLPVALVRDTL